MSRRPLGHALFCGTFVEVTLSEHDGAGGGAVSDKMPGPPPASEKGSGACRFHRNCIGFAGTGVLADDAGDSGCGPHGGGNAPLSADTCGIGVWDESKATRRAVLPVMDRDTDEQEFALVALLFLCLFFRVMSLWHVPLDFL